MLLQALVEEACEAPAQQLTPAAMAWCTASRSTSVACASSCCFCASHWCVTAATAAAVATGATGYTFMATGGNTAYAREGGQRGLGVSEPDQPSRGRTRKRTRDHVQLYLRLPDVLGNPQKGVRALWGAIHSHEDRHHRFLLLSVKSCECPPSLNAIGVRYGLVLSWD